MKQIWLALLTSMLLSSTVADCAEDWPRFRGASGLGHASAPGWNGVIDKDHLEWEVKLPGQGVSSPVIWGQRVFITCADEEAGERSVLCLDVESGRELWQQGESFSSYKKHKNNSFASSTPAVDESGVYVLWQSKEKSHVVAYSHDGRMLWSVDLGSYSHGQGAASSPLVHNGTVYISNDQSEPSFLLALEAKSGTEKWRIPRLGERACYTSPGVWKSPSGTEEILFSHCFEGVTGVDPNTGTELWKVEPFGTFSQRAICSPFETAQGLIIAGSGAQAGDRIIVALRRNPDSADMPIEEVYRIERGAPHVPTPVADESLLYLWGDLGVVTAVNVESGQKAWQHRVGGNYFASPILVDQ
ncbi:MAG: PQQ-binding-like beta-propeller repeat protein, partial [Planctomycetaceae bacterium]|nr:PQQ-binding-like beta-propeller repeat protein [Planctomycetaceae bacterium]